MPIKTILVYLPSEKSTAAILAAALKVAESRNAHVIGLHLIPDFPVYGEFPGEISDEVREQLAKAGEGAARAVKKLFDEAVAGNRVTSEWRCFTAPYALGAEIIANEARTSDLVICGKADYETPDPWGDFSELVIIEGGRPVLLVPSAELKTHIGDHVLIAWNDTREAARAVFDALDFIRDATQVRVLTMIDDEDQREAAEAAGKNLLATVERHGVRASFNVLFASGGDRGEAILSRLSDEDCDLLVMGAYSHSRLREMIFGGVSRDILREATVPTLVSH